MMWVGLKCNYEDPDVEQGGRGAGRRGHDRGGPVWRDGERAVRSWNRPRPDPRPPETSEGTQPRGSLSGF